MSHKATNWLASIAPDLLGHSEFRVLFHLCDCHNPSQGCFPTQAYLMTMTGASNGTVNNALNSLQQKGLIQRHREFDGVTKRQKPTRYTLGFEIEKPDDPSPNFGDGKAPKPTPNSGDGAVSNSEADPSPTERPTRLQPTGEEPVSNLERTSARGAKRANLSKIARFWIDRILDGKGVTLSAIKEPVLQEIRESGLLTEEHLMAHGITNRKRAG